MFQEEILTEENLYFKEQLAVNEDKSIASDEDVPMDGDSTKSRLRQSLQASNSLDSIMRVVFSRNPICCWKQLWNTTICV